jgi:hypothetical protein
MLEEFTPYMFDENQGLINAIDESHWPVEKRKQTLQILEDESQVIFIRCIMMYD